MEDLLAERGITLSREAIRLWCIKFGAIYTRRLRRKHRGFGDTLFIDEVFAGVPDHSINDKQHLIREQHYRDLRISAFAEWQRAVV